MSDIQKLINRLREIIALESQEPLDVLGSFIIGAVLIDYDELYEKLDDYYLNEIADCASDLESKNYTNDEDRDKIWEAIKGAVAQLDEKYTI